MAEEKIEKVIKPVQSEYFQRGFTNSNNMRPTPPTQTPQASSNSGNSTKEK